MPAKKWFNSTEAWSPKTPRFKRKSKRMRPKSPQMTIKTLYEALWKHYQRRRLRLKSSTCKFRPWIGRATMLPFKGTLKKRCVTCFESRLVWLECHHWITLKWRKSVDRSRPLVNTSRPSASMNKWPRRCVTLPFSFLTHPGLKIEKSIGAEFAVDKSSFRI